MWLLVYVTDAFDLFEDKEFDDEVSYKEAWNGQD